MSANQAICGYSLSGGYGPIPRFLYYILLIVSLVFHRVEWLTGSTLGASMIFSSIAAVHAVGLASARGRGTVDLDIIPVYSITGVAMLIGVPLLVWSRMLREAERSVRIVTFSWIGLMFVGVIASLASMKKLPQATQECDLDPTSGALLCNFTCDVPLPMRRGQQIMIIPFQAVDLLDGWSTSYTWLAISLTFMGLVYAGARMHPMEMARQSLRARGISKRLRRKNANRTANCAVCSPPLSVGLSIAHVVLMEVILLRPHGVPVGEDMTAIGQWGPLIGAAFALLASIIQWQLPEEKRMVENRSDDIEMAGNSRPPRATNTTATPTTSNPAPLNNSSPEGRFDPATYFEEGRWWGNVADDLVMNHGGVKWIVREGYLRRLDGQTSSRAVPASAPVDDTVPSTLVTPSAEEKVEESGIK
ncbi:hypothetical protein BDZ97DRAFT_1796378 [Flammula alnicola]|nr:hypothetical protein BDZ97DRAFT_1796378 [Flammula alnicola]